MTRNEHVTRQAVRRTIHLTADQRTCLLTILATNCPMRVPDGSDMAEYVGHDGRLNDRGRELAAWVCLANPECTAQAYSRALDMITIPYKRGQDW